MIGPNKIEDQVLNRIDKNSKMKILTKDRYYIYIGTNGVATGPKILVYQDI